MLLNEIGTNVSRRRRRSGRGPGCGRGKTCGRGMNGQKSRSGASVAALRNHEGGQTSLMRRLPKRGFVKLRQHSSIWNVGKLQKYIDCGKFSSDSLSIGDLETRRGSVVRILGDGSLTSAINLTCNHISDTAKASIEAAGGSVKVIVKKILSPVRYGDKPRVVGENA